MILHFIVMTKTAGLRFGDVEQQQYNKQGLPIVSPERMKELEAQDARRQTMCLNLFMVCAAIGIVVGIVVSVT